MQSDWYLGYQEARAPIKGQTSASTDRCGICKLGSMLNAGAPFAA